MINFHHYPALLGDTLLIEPALDAYARSIQSTVNLLIEPYIRPLFKDHPHIWMLDKEVENFQTLDCSKAFSEAANNGWYFGAGYFSQVGLQYNPGEHRSHFKLFGPPFNSDEIIPHENLVVIAPFGRTCSVHTTGRANKTAPISWWEELIKSFPPEVTVVSLGSASDPNIEGTHNWRGEDLRKVAITIRRAATLITVETGITHLAAACASRVIYLNAATPFWFCAPVAPVHCTTISNPGIPLWSHREVCQTLTEHLAIAKGTYTS